MEVCNIKFHCHVKPSFLIKYTTKIKDSSFVKKTFPSFCVIRIGKFVFNCFFKGYINITGVYNESLIDSALKCLLFCLGLGDNIDIFTSCVIDNITAKSVTVKSRSVDLLAKKKNLQKRTDIISVKYNRERFPNMFIKTNEGTIIWSPNNIVSCVGSKTWNSLNKLDIIISQLDQV